MAGHSTKGSLVGKHLSKKASSFLFFQFGPRLRAPSHSFMVEVEINCCTVNPGLRWQRQGSVGCMKLTHLNAGPGSYGGKPHQKEIKLEFANTNTHTQKPCCL